jgi:hypothetical protein
MTGEDEAVGAGGPSLCVEGDWDGASLLLLLLLLLVPPITTSPALSRCCCCGAGRALMLLWLSLKFGTGAR